MLATLVHLFSEPDHLALAIGAVIVGVFGARLLRRRSRASRQLFGDR
jgi:hypothetical protein